MWCWHHIKNDLNGLCPACRTPYSDDPHAFSAVDRQEVLKQTRQKREKEKKEKHKVLHRHQNAHTATSTGATGSTPSPPPQPSTGQRMVSLSVGEGDSGKLRSHHDNIRAHRVPDRKNLQNIRVVQRNLVYVIGISPSIASEETLRRGEYFGQFGKIVKVVVNRNHSGGSGDPRNASASLSASAYITFAHKEDAKACIQAVDGFWMDGRNVRASFGTTKYCNSFLRNLSCTNPDCLYLHELGEEEDSFTKEQIQSGQNSQFKNSTEVGTTDVVVRVTGNGGPSGTGRRVTNPIMPPPVFDTTASRVNTGAQAKHEKQTPLPQHSPPPIPPASMPRVSPLLTSMDYSSQVGMEMEGLPPPALSSVEVAAASFAASYARSADFDNEAQIQQRQRRQQQQQQQQQHPQQHSLGHNSSGGRSPSPQIPSLDTPVEPALEPLRSMQQRAPAPSSYNTAELWAGTEAQGWATATETRHLSDRGEALNREPAHIEPAQHGSSALGAEQGSAPWGIETQTQSHSPSLDALSAIWSTDGVAHDGGVQAQDKAFASALFPVTPYMHRPQHTGRVQVCNPVEPNGRESSDDALARLLATALPPHDGDHIPDESLIDRGLAEFDKCTAATADLGAGVNTGYQDAPSMQGLKQAGMQGKEYSSSPSDWSSKPVTAVAKEEAVPAPVPSLGTFRDGPNEPAAVTPSLESIWTDLPTNSDGASRDDRSTGPRLDGWGGGMSGKTESGNIWGAPASKSWGGADSLLADNPTNPGQHTENNNINNSNHSPGSDDSPAPTGMALLQQMLPGVNLTYGRQDQQQPQQSQPQAVPPHAVPPSESGGPLTQTGTGFGSSIWMVPGSSGVWSPISSQQTDLGNISGTTRSRGGQQPFVHLDIGSR